MSITLYKNSPVRYEYTACEQKPAGNVVMLHSLGLALEEFDSLLPFFLPSFNVLRYDMLGHGPSEFNAEPVTVEQLVDQMEYMTQLFFNEKFYIVAGPGMGYIAARFCRIHESSVMGLVMVSPQPAFLSHDERKQLVRQVDSKLTHGFEAYKKFLLSHFTFNQDRSLISNLKAQLDLTSEVVHVGLIHNLLTEDFGSDLRHITAPILVLAGTQDILFPSSVYGITANYMEAQLVMIPDAAHLVTVDHPEASARAVLSFIAGLSSETTPEHGFTVGKKEIAHALYKAFEQGAMPSKQSLTVELMHTFRVRIGDVEVTHGWNMRKVKSLFLYLLFHGNVTREEIIEVFWGDLSLGRAQNQLRMNLHFLKTLLNQGETEFLYKDREHIFLQHDIQCDATTYVTRLKKAYARMLCGDLTLPDAQQILEISPTKLVSHVYDDWYIQLRNKIEEQFIALCHWTVDRLNTFQRREDARMYEQMIRKLNVN